MKKSHILLAEFYFSFSQKSPDERFSLIMDIARTRALETGCRQRVSWNSEEQVWEVRTLSPHQRLNT